MRIWIGTLGIVLKLENLRKRKIRVICKEKMDSDTTILLQMRSLIGQVEPGGTSAGGRSVALCSPLVPRVEG